MHGDHWNLCIATGKCELQPESYELAIAIFFTFFDTKYYN